MSQVLPDAPQYLLNLDALALPDPYTADRRGGETPPLFWC